MQRICGDSDSEVHAERLSGGASQETYRLTITVAGAERVLAMRRSAGGVEEMKDPRRPGLAVEAKLMQAAKGAGVPEPEIIHVLEPADELGPGFVMEWLDGETLGSRILRAPELAEVRPNLAYMCGQVLAKIHSIDPVASGLDQHLDVVPTETFVRRVWEQYQLLGTAQPMIDFTAQWLLDNLPLEAAPQLVHNDFRNGNIMVSPSGIAAVLDWELAHLGDPVRDLGWICTNSWRFGRRDFPVGGFGQREELLAGYFDGSGVHIDPAHLQFWEVFGSFWWSVGCLGMAEQWRNGPDRTVERPGIARRSSECQVDCVNLLIPGPVEIVQSTMAASSTDLPTTDELLVSVREFLRDDVRDTTAGRTSFLALVASNSLDIVLRELELGPAHLSAEQARLSKLLGNDGDVADLRWQLTTALRDGGIALDNADLQTHLRSTVVNQVAIDQPKYSGFVAAVGDATTT